MMVAAWMIIDHTKVVESSSTLPSHIGLEEGRGKSFFTSGYKLKRNHQISPFSSEFLKLSSRGGYIYMKGLLRSGMPAVSSLNLMPEEERRQELEDGLGRVTWYVVQTEIISLQISIESWGMCTTS